MSLQRSDGEIRLVGDCGAEDAEPLLAALEREPGRLSVDLRKATRLHTAVIQLLLKFKPRLVGPAGDPFVEQWIRPALPSPAWPMPDADAGETR